MNEDRKMYKSKSGFRQRRLGFDLGGEDGKGLPQLGRGLLQVAGVHLKEKSWGSATPRGSVLQQQ
jgi:hypothetical protein